MSCERNMSHITFSKISHSFGEKICFNDFSRTIYSGQRIAIIGSNGSGKSTLLNIIRGAITPSEGEIKCQASIAYVPQNICEPVELSGGQRFNKALSQALLQAPEVLCLDEPTNHLDQKNRRSLTRMLARHTGTLIIVSHDVALLRQCVDEIWHIEAGKVHCFNGHYDEYIQHWENKRHHLEQQLKQLKRDKKQVHVDLMREQQRYKKRKAYGEKKYADDRLLLSGKKVQGENTTAKKRQAIAGNKQEIVDELNSIRIAEVITPTFTLSSSDCSPQKTLLHISDGGCAYGDYIILQHMQWHIKGGERWALKGDNGSGKSTVLKAIMQAEHVTRSGDWQISKDIAYLDQHYANLANDSSVIDMMSTAKPDWTMVECRRHLNDFLFKSNEVVSASVSTLSGGERSRLSLALCAALSPKLLLLDEVTNNLDLASRAHVIQVLKAYPGALLLVSHDEDFLKEIGIEHIFLTQTCC